MKLKKPINIKKDCIYTSHFSFTVGEETQKIDLQPSPLMWHSCLENGKWCWENAYYSPLKIFTYISKLAASFVRKLTSRRTS